MIFVTSRNNVNFPLILDRINDFVLNRYPDRKKDHDYYGYLKGKTPKIGLNK